MVSEVIFPRFWGVVCIEKCFRNFEIVIGSAVSEISRFARFYVKLSQFALLADTSITAKVGTPLLWSPLTPEEDQLPASGLHCSLCVTKTFFPGQNLTQTTNLDSRPPLPRKDPLPAPCKLPHCPCSALNLHPTPPTELPPLHHNKIEAKLSVDICFRTKKLKKN